MQLTASFRSLLLIFRDVFTAPTFATFVTIAAGWCLSPRHRYITEMIQAAKPTPANKLPDPGLQCPSLSDGFSQGGKGVCRTRTGGRSRTAAGA
jgi:hypothetical protein